MGSDTINYHTDNSSQNENQKNLKCNFGLLVYNALSWTFILHL